MTAYALRDSATMLRRNLRHLRRYPGLSLFPLLMPVVFLLLFVYVFGGTLGDGLGRRRRARRLHRFRHARDAGVHHRRRREVVAISVAMDMTKGIIARFKTMRDLAARRCSPATSSAPAADGRQLAVFIGSRC